MATGLSPRKDFQDLILTLQKFWGAQGCVILQPYDTEVGAGTFHPATFLRALGPRALERRLRAALAPAEGRPLRREPEPAAALLPVPGDPEADAARHPGPLPASRCAPSASTRRATTSASSRTTGRARRSAPGASAGRCGSTAWRSRSSPTSSRSAASTATPVVGRAHLRARAHRHVRAGRRQRLRPRTSTAGDAASSPTATCSCRPSRNIRGSTSSTPTRRFCCSTSRMPRRNARPAR